MYDDLITRLAAAIEGSRVLDGLIWRAIEPEGEWWEFEDGWARRDPDDGGYVMAAPYTTSLDVAMTLVPEGMSIDIHIGPRGLNNNATVYQPVKSTDGQGRRVTTFVHHEAEALREGVLHWTPVPIQVCIAALRAKAALPTA